MLQEINSKLFFLHSSYSPRIAPGGGEADRQLTTCASVAPVGFLHSRFGLVYAGQMERSSLNPKRWVLYSHLVTRGDRHAESRQACDMALRLDEVESIQLYGRLGGRNGYRTHPAPQSGSAARAQDVLRASLQA
jgi:hypothetical protein